MPGHTSREVLIVFSSLTTCDPANIYDLIKVRNQRLTASFSLEAVRQRDNFKAFLLLSVQI